MTTNYKLSLRIAGNTQNPTLTVLVQKGYVLHVEEHVDESLSWNGEKDGRLFSATGAEELLGLVTMWEHRGDDWQAKEHEPDICDQLLAEA